VVSHGPMTKIGHPGRALSIVPRDHRRGTTGDEIPPLIAAITATDSDRIHKAQFRLVRLGKSVSMHSMTNDIWHRPGSSEGFSPGVPGDAALRAILWTAGKRCCASRQPPLECGEIAPGW
jgi:hypothetical protein